jgi:hypothetical protein
MTGITDKPIELRYPIEDWRYEVANGDTILGLEDWRAAEVAANDTSCKHPNLTGHNEYKTCAVCGERKWIAGWSDR